MKNDFMIRIPEKNTQNNCSNVFFYDSKNKTLSNFLADSHGIKKNSEKSLKFNEKDPLDFLLMRESHFLSSFLATYQPMEALNERNVTISYAGQSTTVPDYVVSFGLDDIFYRYRYYPDKDVVRFYLIVRTFLRQSQTLLKTVPSPKAK